MDNSVANYLFRNLDRMVNITPHMEESLKKLFTIWDAYNIDIDEFRRKYDMPEDAGVFTILPFMTRNANNPDYVDTNNDDYYVFSI